MWDGLEPVQAVRPPLSVVGRALGVIPAEATRLFPAHVLPVLSRAVRDRGSLAAPPRSMGPNRSTTASAPFREQREPQDLYVAAAFRLASVYPRVHLAIFSASAGGASQFSPARQRWVSVKTQNSLSWVIPTEVGRH